MRRALLLALAVLALPLQAADLKPFSASYTADWKQLPMSGTALTLAQSFLNSLAIIIDALKFRSQVPLAFLTRLRSAVPLMGSCFQSAV